jgi:hypothetical protein
MSTATPTHTPTNTPTATPTLEPTSTTTFTPAVEVPAPIVIAPNAGDLPAAKIIDAAAQDTILVLPESSRSQFSPLIVKKIIGWFKKKSIKISPAKVVSMLQNIELNEVTINPLTATRSISRMVSGEARIEALASKKGKVSKIRTRLSRITVARLTPGQTYSVTYKKVYNLKKIKRTFSSKASPPAIFRKQ